MRNPPVESGQRVLRVRQAFPGGDGRRAVGGSAGFRCHGRWHRASAPFRRPRHFLRCVFSGQNRRGHPPYPARHHPHAFAAGLHGGPPEHGTPGGDWRLHARHEECGDGATRCILRETCRGLPRLAPRFARFPAAAGRARFLHRHHQCVSPQARAAGLPCFAEGLARCHAGHGRLPRRHGAHEPRGRHHER